MGKVIKNDLAMMNSLSSKNDGTNYLDYQKSIVGAKHDNDFMFASDIFPVKKEYPVGSGVFKDIIARVQRITIPDKAQFLGDDYRKLLFKELNEPVEVGYKFILDNDKWVCYNTDNMGAITKTCHIRRCNSSLRWKNKYGAIEEEPCVVDYFKFTFTNNSIEFDKQMRLGGNLRLLIVQANSKTNTFERDMRFIFNGLSWRITNMERLGHDGLIEITVEEHQVDKTSDSMVERVADFNSPSKYSIKVDSNRMTLAVGESNTVAYKVMYDGTETNEKCVFESSSILLLSFNENTVTGIAEGQAKIRVSLENSYNIYTEIDVIINELDETSYIFGVDQTKFSGVYSYVVNNPVDPFYTFRSDDKTVSILQTDEKSCTVKMPTTKKSFVLMAVGGTETLSKTIDIRSMWE